MLSLVASVVLACSVAQGAAESLIANGSFEDAPAGRRYVNVVAGESSVQGWQVVGSSIDVIRTEWPASHGLNSIDLDGDGRTPAGRSERGGLAQTFPTKPGNRYRVTFDMAGNPFGLPALKPLRLSAADQ